MVSGWKKTRQKKMPHIAPLPPPLTSYFAILHGQAKQHPLSQSPGVFRFFFVFFCDRWTRRETASRHPTNWTEKLEGTQVGETNHQDDWLVVSNMFYFHPYLGKIPILTYIFQMGWNHQLDECCCLLFELGRICFSMFGSVRWKATQGVPKWTYIFAQVVV